jgi:hypothetical protein
MITPHARATKAQLAAAALAHIEASSWRNDMRDAKKTIPATNGQTRRAFLPACGDDVVFIWSVA